MTRTFTPTSTFTPTASYTPTPTDTPTVTETPRFTNVEGTDYCITPFGWVSYVVREGDTLPTIARATRTTAAQLRSVNCMAETDQIRVGDSILVPGPRATVTSPNEQNQPEGCPNPGAVITSPLPGAMVPKTFTVEGTASIANFEYYQLEIRADNDKDYRIYSRSTRPVVDGSLGPISTRPFGSGLHWVKLTVVDDQGEENAATCVIPMVFE